MSTHHTTHTPSNRTPSTEPPSWAERMRDVASHTQPSPDAVARVAARLDAALVPATDLLSELPPVPPAAVDRVAARLAARPTPSPWVSRAPVAALALVAVGAVSTGVVATTLWPETPAALVDEAGRVVSPDGVFLDDRDGEGELHMVGSLLAVDWVVGRLALQPSDGLEVAVSTREALVEGTALGVVVHRDALGTRVEVTSGEARVSCEGDAAMVAAGAAKSCLPTTPTGLLVRARALDDAGRPHDAAAAATHGLSLEPEPAVAVELLHLLAGQRLGAGDLPGAVDAAEQALALGVSTRADELHRLAARGWLVAGECARALPHLQQLASLDEREAQHRDRCKAILEE